MKDLLIKAITERKVLSFIYKGQLKIVEPFTLGIHKDTFNLLLSAWYLEGESDTTEEPDWRLYTVSKIEHLEVKDIVAFSFRIGYNPKDERMSEIISTV